MNSIQSRACQSSSVAAEFAGAGGRDIPFLAACAVFVLALAAAPPLAAQTTVDIGLPGNLITATATTAPGSGDLWILDSPGIYLVTAVTLPAGSPGLKIDGTGYTLTLNHGGVAPFGSFDASGASTFNFSNVTITGGRSTGPSGVITTAGGNITIKTDTDADVSFVNNIAFGHGGVIYDGGGAFTVGSDDVLHPADSIAFTGNSAGYDAAGTNLGDAVGGAIAVSSDVGLTATTITLSDNKAAGFVVVGGGGAIFSYYGPVNLTGAVTLSGNSTTANSGGGIYSGGVVTITGDLIANNNEAVAGSGGAIFANSGGVTVTGGVSAANNFSSGEGGFIDAPASTIALATAGGDVTLRDNISSLHGGAINANTGAIAIGNATSPGAISITGNRAGFTADGMSVANWGSVGGALGEETTESVSLTGATITLSDNIAAGGNGIGAGAGAIYAVGSATLTATGAITVSGNTAMAGSGGAIYTLGDLTLTSGGNMTISDNSAGGTGGALWAGGNVPLAATAGNITFSGNQASGLANAIYLNNTGGGKAMPLVTAAGYAITFFDPIQSNAANGPVSVIAQGGGRVIFDGSNYPDPADTADHWSQLYGNTEVKDGTTFAVQNNAIYGTLAAGGSSFTVNGDTTLAGGIMGEVRADHFALDGTLDISGSTALGSAPGTSSGGFSTFKITSSSAGSVALAGTIEFNTCLNDASTQLSDVLELSTGGGAITGPATLVINPVTDAACEGATTTGNGILLVQSDSPTNNLFAVASGTVLLTSANGNNYSLVQVGNNWYLKNPPPSSRNINATPIPALNPMALILLALLVGGGAARRYRLG